VRADAQRNRERIVEVAREVFRERGYDAPLDDIAKQAGVGPGTLYRHFPNRDALLDAVMQAWVDRVTEATDKALAHEGSAREFLLSWCERYVALISLHKGGPAKITSAIGDPSSPLVHKTGTLLAANQRIVEHLDALGALRPGVDALQLSRLVGGVAVVADQGGLDAAAVRPLLEVVADGLLAAR
jgi:AcrR family transcriptional regulator